MLDDFGLAKLSAENRRDLLEIIEDRHAMRSTIVTSQLPVEKWHGVVGDPTLADAILDRLVHSAYQLNLKGDSMRKRRRPLTQTDHRGTIAGMRTRAGALAGARLGRPERPSLRRRAMEFLLIGMEFLLIGITAVPTKL